MASFTEIRNYLASIYQGDPEKTVPEVMADIPFKTCTSVVRQAMHSLGFPPKRVVRKDQLAFWKQVNFDLPSKELASIWEVNESMVETRRRHTRHTPLWDHRRKLSQPEKDALQIAITIEQAKADSFR